MYDVIVSRVSTGSVVRKSFLSEDNARSYAAGLLRKYSGTKNGIKDHRVELVASGRPRPIPRA